MLKVYSKVYSKVHSKYSCQVFSKVHDVVSVARGGIVFTLGVSSRFFILVEQFVIDKLTRSMSGET